MKACYPDHSKALATAESDDTGIDYSEEGRKQVREAFEFERTRLWDNQPPAREAETALGREIQKQIGPPAWL